MLAVSFGKTGSLRRPSPMDNIAQTDPSALLSASRSFDPTIPSPVPKDVGSATKGQNPPGLALVASGNNGSQNVHVAVAMSALGQLRT